MSQFIEMFGTIDEPKVEVKKLIDVVLSSGQYGSNTSATDYQEGKPRYIRITDINDDGSLNDDIKTAEVIEDKYRLIPGDIVFARTGATVGKTYMHETGNAIYAGYLIKYQMNESKMKPAFMKAFTHSKTYYNWVANSQKVGAQPNISAAQYDNMPVLVPQIEKQEEFLAIYHQADKSGFDGLKSQFIEMFKGDFPKLSWEECLTIINGKKYDDDYQESGTYPICGSGGIMGYGERMLCPKDTVILGRKGNINSPIYMETDYWIVDTAFCLDVDRTKLHPKYFYFWCKLFDFTRYNKQGVLPSLTKNDLLKIEMPIPPMELQTKFVDIIEQSDKSGFELRKSIEAIDAVIKRLISC